MSLLHLVALNQFDNFIDFYTRYLLINVIICALPNIRCKQFHDWAIKIWEILSDPLEGKNRPKPYFKLIVSKLRNRIFKHLSHMRALSNRCLLLLGNRLPIMRCSPPIRQSKADNSTNHDRPIPKNFTELDGIHSMVATLKLATP